MKAIFFSDIHLDFTKRTAGLRLEYPIPIVQDAFTPLIDLLKARFHELNNKISLLVFLGDYAIGEMKEEDKEEVFIFMRDFAKKIESEIPEIFDDIRNIKDRIIFVNGNHDVMREGKHHNSFERIFGDYITPYTKSSNLHDVRKNGAPVFVYNDLDLTLACVSTVENAGAHIASQDKLLQLIDLIHESSEREEAKKIVRKTMSVDIGSITPDTIQKFTDFTSDLRTNTNMVISHHPFIHMQHGSSAHYITVQGIDFLDNARSRGFTLFVHGHVHEFSCTEISSRGKNSDLPVATIISVPSFFNAGDGSIQFVELDVDGSDYQCQLLTFNKSRYRIEQIESASSKEITAKVNRGNHSYEHILLDFEIKEIIELGEIVKFGSTERIEAASYDCALGMSFKRYDSENNHWPTEPEQMQLIEGGPAKIRLDPGETVLLYTHEEFSIPDNMLLQASPRASWIRKGIGVDLSFFVEPGFFGTFCFPVTNKNQVPIEISSQDAIMSVVFHQLSSRAHGNWQKRHPDNRECRANKLDT